MTTPSASDCALCIDGFMPAGVQNILGPVVKPCPTCLPVCPTCTGRGVFPATQRCLHCFTTDLATGHGLAPVLCAGCHGVIAIIPYPPSREVTP